MRQVAFHCGSSGISEGSFCCRMTCCQRELVMNTHTHTALYVCELLLGLEAVQISFPHQFLQRKVVMFFHTMTMGLATSRTGMFFLRKCVAFDIDQCMGKHTSFNHWTSKVWQLKQSAKENLGSGAFGTVLKVRHYGAPWEVNIARNICGFFGWGPQGGVLFISVGFSMFFFSEIAGGEGNPKFLANLIKLYQLLITGFWMIASNLFTFIWRRMEGHPNGSMTVAMFAQWLQPRAKSWCVHSVGFNWVCSLDTLEIYLEAPCNFPHPR